MSVLIRMQIPETTREQYEGMNAQVVSSLKQSPGFQSHVGIVDEVGLTVVEVWESEAEWQNFFDAKIRPNMQGEVPQPEISQIASYVTP